MYCIVAGSASRSLTLDKQRKEEFVRLLAGNVTHVTSPKPTSVRMLIAGCGDGSYCIFNSSYLHIPV